MQEMKIGPASAREHLLRQQSGQKMKLKEKFVEIYDMFLRVNEEYLSSSLAQTSEDQLLAIKDGINNIFLHAVQAMRDPLPQRRLHAMQTLTIVLGEIFRKKFHNWSFDVIHLLTGLSHADLVFRTLVQGLGAILGSDETLEIQVVALRLAIALACGNDNVNKNSLNEYFMQKDIFSSMIKFFMMVQSTELAFEAMALLGLLANYNKYEIQNPYLTNLAQLKDEAVLQKMCTVIVHVFDSMRKGYVEVMEDDELSTVSKLTSALSYVTGMLWNPKAQDSSATDTAFAQLPDGRVTVLLIFYDLIYSNKRFMHIYLNYSTSTANSSQQNGASTSSAPPQLASSLDATETGETGLGSFLSFSSYLLQHNRTHRSAPYTHLCLIIMLIITEDSTSISHLCSIPQTQDQISSLPLGAASGTETGGANKSNVMATVRLCRQRQPVLPKVKQARPMAAVFLDVVLGFLKHNMKKRMQVDCFRRFKILRVRLPYHWVEMWNTLQGLVKFLQSNGKAFEQQPDARDLAAETIDLVNYFVTFGDLIMPDPASLYALYYEIIRSGIEPFSDLAKQFSIAVQPPLPAPLPHHDLTSRNRLNLAGSPSPSSSPVTTPPQSALSSPSPAPASILSSPLSSFQNSYRSPSPMSAVALAAVSSSQQQRVIIIDLSNINQVYTFFFTHLLTWRDASPTRSLGPDLVTTIIKTHYQDLTLVPIPLDAFLGQRQSRSAAVSVGLKGLNGGGNGAAAAGVAGPHPGWDGYSEVPGKVPFFRQLTRWVVADLRAVSKEHAFLVAEGGKAATVPLNRQ
ncbi:hypothetical protein BGZ99_001601 [Dissophora globulifera]|uniref:Armadillo-like helical domain-containing protein n=1 Tax=Dissophora globulifera TaxID=979702 RepID=A0A9P6RTD6_9FUNG|nr:hypothetical protein BGZ99_001601 [Dissophora globulifera]